MLNATSQRRTKSLFVWFYVKGFTDLNQQTWWTDVTNAGTNKSMIQSKSLTKIWIKEQNSIITQAGENRLYPSARLDRMNAHKHTSLKRIGKPNCWRMKPNETQRTLGRSKLANITLYSHSINKVPSQENADLKRREKCCSVC